MCTNGFGVVVLVVVEVVIVIVQFVVGIVVVVVEVVIGIVVVVGFVVEFASMAPLQWPLKIKKILKKTKIEKIKSNNYSIRLLNLNRYYIYRPLLFDLVILFNNTWINYMHVLLNQFVFF